MTRFAKVTPTKDVAMQRAEKKAQTMLYQYLRQRHGIQREVSKKSGIVAPMLSRLANREGQVIALEAAMRIEVATNGDLKAEQLCPSGADILKQFLELRAEVKEA